MISTENTSINEHVSNQNFSIVAPNVGHATLAAPGQERHITLYIDPDYIAHFGKTKINLDFETVINGSGFWQSSEILNSILRLHDQLSQEVPLEIRSQRLQHLNHLLFEECAQIIAESKGKASFSRINRNANLIREIQAYISENLQGNLDIDYVGHQFHLSRRHLTRLFKEFAKETFVDFTNRSRVELAFRLIHGTQDSILDIGLAVGIESPSYLAKLFKRHLGILPSDCRKFH